MYAYFPGIGRGYYCCRECGEGLKILAKKLQEKITLTDDDMKFDCQMKEPKNDSKN